MDTNPVVIRRIVAYFRETGLVQSTRGKGGGLALARPASEITLGQIADVLDENLGFDLHTVSDEKDHLKHAILNAVEAQRRELHTAALNHMDLMTLEDVTHAATLRADLARLMEEGVSETDIRTKYRIKNGRLVLK